MSRLTINEQAATGYTDEIILTPSDFTTEAGNTTTLVNVPVKKGDVIHGAAVEVTEVFSTGSATIAVGFDASVTAGSADPDAFVEEVRVDQLNTSADDGASLIVNGADGGAATNLSRIVAAADANLTLTASTALNADTSGKLRVLLAIRRINA